MKIAWLMVMPIVLGSLLVGRVSVAADITVLCTIGVRSVLQQVIPEFERSSGHRIVASYDVANVLKRRIDSGESFDVAVLTAPVIDELVKQGKLVEESRVTVARGGMGLANAVGATKHPIPDEAAFKRVLLESRSVAYPKEGLAGLFFQRVQERLDIAGSIRSKSRLTGAESPAELVARGDAEIAAHIIPELLAVPGVQFLGPFPANLQSYIVIPGALSSQSKERNTSQQFLRYLVGPTVALLMRERGYEPNESLK